MKTALFAAAVVVFVLADARADECEPVLQHGVFDISDATIDREFTQRLINWFSAAWSRDAGVEKSGNFSAEARYGLFAAGGAGSQYFKDWEDVRSAVANFQSEDVARKEKLAAFARIASPVIVNAWAECVRSSQNGVVVGLKWTSDPNVVYVIFSYRSSDIKRSPSVNLRSVRGSGMRCDPGRRELVSHSAPTPIRCTRTANKPASVDFLVEGSLVSPKYPVFDVPSIPDLRTACPTVPDVVAAVKADTTIRWKFLEQAVGREKDMELSDVLLKPKGVLEIESPSRPLNESSWAIGENTILFKDGRGTTTATFRHVSCNSDGSISLIADHYIPAGKTRPDYRHVLETKQARLTLKSRK